MEKINQNINEIFVRFIEHYQTFSNKFLFYYLFLIFHNIKNLIFLSYYFRNIIKSFINFWLTTIS